MAIVEIIFLSTKQLAIVSIVLGSYASLINWVSFFQNLRNKDEDPCPILPIVGASFLLFGLAYFDTTRPFAFLSIILDYGTLAFLIAVPYLIREAWQTSRFNLVKKFIADSGNAKYEIRLYKKNKFVINVKFDPPEVSNEHGAKIIEFGLTGKWQENNNVIQFQENYGKLFMLTQNNNEYVMKETNYPREKQYKYDCLDGIVFSIK
jgi:hypothetical protein